MTILPPQTKVPASISYDRPKLPRLPYVYIILSLSVMAWGIVGLIAWAIIALLARLGLWV